MVFETSMAFIERCAGDIPIAGFWRLEWRFDTGRREEMCMERSTAATSYADLVKIVYDGPLPFFETTLLQLSASTFHVRSLHRLPWKTEGLWCQ